MTVDRFGAELGHLNLSLHFAASSQEGEEREETSQLRGATARGLSAAAGLGSEGRRGGGRSMVGRRDRHLCVLRITELLQDFVKDCTRRP